MRILYDGQVYSMQATGGINRYFANIIGRLPLDYSPTLVVNHERGVSYPSHPNLELYRFGNLRLQDFSYRLSRLGARFEDALLRRRLADEKFDLFHPTYYSLLTARFNRRPCPTVITVWDMIHELFSKQMDPTGQYSEEKKRAIMSAQHVICISESTKKDLLEIYRLNEASVSVTPLASDIDVTMSHGPERTPDRPYYLYVGSRDKYKNFEGLLRVFARVVSIKPDLDLAVAGRNLTESEKRLIDELKLSGHMKCFIYPSDDHLAKLYRCALALVYPSLYEGFGIPPLEAMSCGTVAVVSNVSSLPEVVGGAGVLFDPTSGDELADILITLAENESRRQELIEKGLKRVQRFGWDKTVARTLEIYRSLAR